MVEQHHGRLQHVPRWMLQGKKLVVRTATMRLIPLLQAGPSECALVNAKDESSSDIRSRLEDWLDDLFMNPMAVPNATMPSILTSGAASSE